MALDHALFVGRENEDGFLIEEFAEDWDVTVKTVRRDLDAFAELGMKIEYERVVPFGDPHLAGYYWRYCDDQKRPMFCRTIHEYFDSPTPPSKR